MGLACDTIDAQEGREKRMDPSSVVTLLPEHEHHVWARTCSCLGRDGAANGSGHHWEDVLVGEMVVDKWQNWKGSECAMYDNSSDSRQGCVQSQPHFEKCDGQMSHPIPRRDSDSREERGMKDGWNGSQRRMGSSTCRISGRIQSQP
jgi:hypothetical protein